MNRKVGLALLSSMLIVMLLDAKKVVVKNKVKLQKNETSQPYLPVPAKRKVEDKLLAIIYHPEETVLICQSDLRADLSEKQPTLRDAIIRELIVLDGKKLKITVTDAEVDRYLARIQEQLKLNKEELEAFFKKQGFRLDQARKQLEKSILIENVIEARIRSKAHVSKFDIEEYHQKNPIEFYMLSRAHVPFNGGSKALTKALIEREIASGDVNATHTWQDIGRIDSKDFAPEKAYIKNLKPGSVVIADEADDELVLLRLESKTELSFEERKNDIANLLRQERYEKVQNGYYEKLIEDAKVRYIT